MKLHRKEKEKEAVQAEVTEEVQAEVKETAQAEVKEADPKDPTDLVLAAREAVQKEGTKVAQAEVKELVQGEAKRAALAGVKRAVSAEVKEAVPEATEVKGKTSILKVTGQKEMTVAINLCLNHHAKSLVQVVRGIKEDKNPNMI